MEKILLIIYGGALLFIFCYSLVQLNLVYHYLKYHRKKKVENNGKRMKDGHKKLDINNNESIPFVTVQLPIYNELYVVERLMDAVANLNYPKKKLEIQVLDDSTDETVDVIAKKAEQIQHRGIQIVHIRRKNRLGFKAGALAEGLKSAKGEFIALFDADFIPDSDFLLNTIPYFENTKIGVVQTKWEHLNENYSLLTKIQAFGLNAHFSVEQKGRNAGGHFINFNGTAGIWRKECIIDAGGWEHDTITEDLDLSYRAQLEGWEFLFLEDVGSPAELPATMNALKTQQFRWTKGAAECAKKHLWKVLKSPQLSIATKIHAFFHLMNSFIFICIILTALLSIPIIIIKKSFPEYAQWYNYASLFLFSLLILSVFYWISMAKKYQNKLHAFKYFVKRFPLFLSVSMGLSLHNAIAVLEGYIGKKTPFIRTPKFNIKTANDSWKGKKYLISSVNRLTIIEGILTIYFLAGIFIAFILNDYGLLPFHLMLAFGFGYVCYYSFRHI